MRKVLVDTSIIIEFQRRSDEERGKTVLVKLIKSDFELAYSILTYFEIYSGRSVWEKEKARQTVDTVFEGGQILALDASIALKAGGLRARLGLSAMDALIAATALHHQLPLVTFNRKDFAQVPSLELFEGPQQSP